jgi:sugar phosphate isomerase/epimerase
MQYIMHSYTMRDFPVEEAFAHASRCGYDGIEMQRIHFNEHYLENEMPKLSALSKENNLPIHCIGFTGSMISDDLHEIEETLSLVEKNIRICGEHAIPLMNGFTGMLVGENPDNWGANGSALANDVHVDRCVKALKHLSSVAGDAGVTLTLEIHMNTIHDTIASTGRLLDLVDSPHLLANPDPGNMFATSTAEKEPDALRALKGRIGYFHFKNCRLNGNEFDYSAFLADGDIDIPGYVNAMKESGYSGPVCIEYVGSRDMKESAKADLAFLKSLA